MLEIPYCKNNDKIIVKITVIINLLKKNKKTCDTILKMKTIVSDCV